MHNIVDQVDGLALKRVAQLTTQINAHKAAIVR